MLGEITNAKLLGGWTLKLESAEKLPQDLASAFGKLFGEKVGGSYTPVFYVGTQLVNGFNHKLIAERNMLVSGGKTIKDFAVVTINIPAGDIRGERATKVDETDATDFVLRDEIEKGIKKAMADFKGSAIKPLLELGEQIVKGINYHFICECKGNYSAAATYLVHVVINNFQDNWTIEQIIKL